MGKKKGKGEANDDWFEDPEKAKGNKGAKKDRPAKSKVEKEEDEEVSGPATVQPTRTVAIDPEMTVVGRPTLRTVSANVGPDHIVSYHTETASGNEGEPVREMVLGDYRLEFVALLKLDTPSEIIMVEVAGGDDDFVAVSLEDGVNVHVPYVTDEHGWMLVPPVRRYIHDGNEVHIGSDWYAGLRYLLDYETRSLLQFHDFAQRCFRIIMIPLPSEACARLIILTNGKRTLNALKAEPHSRTAQFFSHYLLMPPAGEWKGTRDVQDPDLYAAAQDASQRGHRPPAALATPRSASARAVTFSDVVTSSADEINAPPEAAAETLSTQVALTGQGEAAVWAGGVAPPSYDAAVGAAYQLPPTTSAAAAPAAPSAAAAAPAQLSTEAPPSILKGKRRAAPAPVSVPTTANTSLLPGGTAAGFNSPRTPAGVRLFPHQRRTVAWMMQREATTERDNRISVPDVKRFHDLFVYSTGIEKNFLKGQASVRCGVLPRGGVVGHPVGAGKTVISVGLIGKTRGQGVSLVCVPDHIVVQWSRELVRFVPDLVVKTVTDPHNWTLPGHICECGVDSMQCDDCLMPQNGCMRCGTCKRLRRGSNPTTIGLDHEAVDVVLCSYSMFNNNGWINFVKSFCWRRAFFDEPQDVSKMPYFQDLVTLRVRHRWVLTATPFPLHLIMELTLGESLAADEKAAQALRATFTRVCCRRDLASDCLPVPKLHMHMLPVTLTWQETSVVHVHAMSNKLQATIRLCSFFANVDAQGRPIDMPAQPQGGGAKKRADGTTAYNSLDDWVTQHRSIHENVIRSIEPELDRLSKQLRDARALFLAQKRERQIKMQAEQERLEREAAEARAAAGPAPAVALPEVVRIERKDKGEAAEGRGAGAAVDDEPEYDEKGKRKPRIKFQEIQLTREQAEAVVLQMQGRDETDMKPEERFLLRTARKVLNFGGDVFQQSGQRGASGMNEAFDTGIDPALSAAHADLAAQVAHHRRLLAFMDSVVSTLAAADAECSVCMDTLNNQLVTMLPCLHAFCATCVVKMFAERPSAICPMCRSSTQRRSLVTFTCSRKKPVEAPTPAPAAGPSSGAAPVKRGMVDPSSSDFRGSKIETLVAAIDTVLEQSPNDKVLVFGQWETLLRQISEALTGRGVQNSVLGGTMLERSQTMDRFRSDTTPRVMLLSYEQHASGANLDVANHVFIVHPYCPGNVETTTVVPLELAQAFERQAIGRVHRFPQKKDVHVYRMFARGTVEEDLYAVWGWI